jgi:hypothetical protein
VDIDVIRDKMLSMNDKLVYSFICTHATPQIRECSIRVETLAEESGYSVLEVEKSLKTLIERGVLERIECFGEDEHEKNSVYKLIGYRAPCYAGTRSMLSIREDENTGRSQDEHYMDK